MLIALTMLAHDASLLLAAVDEHSLAKLGSTDATRGQHTMRAAQSGADPPSPPPPEVVPPSPPLEPLAGPPVHGDSQLCVSQAKPGPSQLIHEPVMQAWSWDTHSASRQLTHAVE